MKPVDAAEAAAKAAAAVAAVQAAAQAQAEAGAAPMTVNVIEDPRGPLLQPDGSFSPLTPEMHAPRLPEAPPKRRRSQKRNCWPNWTARPTSN